MSTIKNALDELTSDLFGADNPLVLIKPGEGGNGANATAARYALNPNFKLESYERKPRTP